MSSTFLPRCVAGLSHSKLLSLAVVASALACTPSPRAVAPDPSPPPAARAEPASAPPGALAPDAAPPAARAPDPERGGRLYDSWRTERRLSHRFVYDSASTAEPDGKGGPNGNGTLNDGNGRPMLNTGHDYRLRSFFGWDLRGKQGLGGPRYQGERFVLERNLLEDTRSPEEIQAWLRQGDAEMPGYGQVLDEPDLVDLAAFLVRSRDGAIARPEQVFQLDARAPENYRLLPGADTARGAELFDLVCSNCHGNDGRQLLLDGGNTVGTFARARASEAWFKIQNGLAGSPMKGQIAATDGAGAARTLLDLLGALCDRQQFPRRYDLPTKDVEDGDRRCGAYLK